jgi:hypothetical protein
VGNRKHITELALSFYSDALLIVHPKDIGKIDDQSDEGRIAADCHIYFIVKRPRLSFVPGSIVVGEKQTTGKFRYVTHGVVSETEFRLEGKSNADELRISSYPHHKLSLIKNGEEFASLPAHLLSVICDGVDDPSIRDVEVAYVGMSYAEGRRSAKDRLLSHSTLQQVLADLNNDAPDDEALIIMAQFAPPQTMISFDGADESLKEEDDRDVSADLAKQEQFITEDLQVALIEAGLIRYFQPPYNEKYKNRFPHPTLRILKEVYEIDFGALSVELNTESINLRVFSHARGPGFHHLASVDLHDPHTRRSFFNFINADPGTDAEDYSGPLF